MPTSKNQEIAARLQELGNKLGGMVDLAKKLGIKSQELTPYWTGKSKPGPKFQQRLRDIGLNVEYIMTGKRSLFERSESILIEPKGNFYPVVSSINAGDPQHIFVKENYEGFMHVEYPTKDNCYLLKVIGTSMEYDGPRCIRDGELVFVDMNIGVLNGDIVVVSLLSGRQMVKQVLFESIEKEALVTLHSFNPQQPDIIIRTYDILSMNRVVMVIPKPRWI